MLYQIKMTPLGVLTSLEFFDVKTLEKMSHLELRNAMIDCLSHFCNEPIDVFQKIPDNKKGTEKLVGLLAILAFLRCSRQSSDQQLQKWNTGDQTNEIVIANNKYTNIPVLRIQSLNHAQLVQMALMWFTKIEPTYDGTLSLFEEYSNGLHEMTDTDKYDATVILLTKYSANEDMYFWQQTTDDINISKYLAILAFLRRAKIKTDAELKSMTVQQQRKSLILENYYRTGIPYQFLDPTPGLPYQFMDEMSDEEHLEIGLSWYTIDKPYVKYNEISSAMAHDSHTGDAYTGHMPGTHDSYKDQDRTITEQLDSGIRTVRISSDGGDLEHSNYEFGTLGNYLKKVKEFLAKNPFDIFTIIDESNWTSTTVKVYENKAWKDLFFVPGENGMPSIEELERGNWPTLKQMVAAGKRIVLMVNKQPYDTKFPYRLPAYDLIDKPFMISMDKSDYLLDVDYNYRPPFKHVKNDNKGRWSAHNYLYLLNHYFYKEFGRASTSVRRYAKWGGGELLIEYTALAWSLTGKKPNYINVDFYDRDSKPTNFLFNVVKALNRPDAMNAFMLPLRIKKDIILTDTISLQIGATYTITCWQKDVNGNEFNITREAEAPNNNGTWQPQKISMQRANNQDAQQHWKLVYNTPATGISIVSPDLKYAIYDHAAESTKENPQPIQAFTAELFYSIGKLNTGFAIKSIDNGKWIIYKSDMLSTKDPFEQGLSVLEVTYKDKAIGTDHTISRWSYNKEHWQYWKFTKVTIPSFVPPALPPGNEL